jgi:uncharacterized membrane protein YphA (DoxX/SURF4 family)
MKAAVLTARVLLGAPLIVFGLNGFLNFLEQPNDFSPAATAFLTALNDSQYLLPLKSGVEVASGVMILTGLFLPLGLTLFAPILVNIVAFHLYLDDPVKGIVGYAMLLLELFLVWAYAPSYRGVLAVLGRSRFSDRD